ncbi:MAG: hypothetical protein ACMV1B_08535, partial [Prevotella sp.]
SKIYRGSNEQYVQNGDVVPAETTHLRVLINGKVEDVAMSPIASGTVSFLTETSATIGGSNVYFAPWIRNEIKEYTDIVYKASGGNSAVENMIAGIPVTAKVGDVVKTAGYHKDGDAGAASYRIVSPQEAGDITNTPHIALQSGMVAFCVHGPDVKLDWFGAQRIDDYGADDLNNTALPADSELESAVIYCKSLAVDTEFREWSTYRLQGSGSYNLSSGHTITCSISAKGLLRFIPKLTAPQTVFNGESVININLPRNDVPNTLRLDNANGVNNTDGTLIGLRATRSEVSLNGVVSRRFPINFQVGTYSVTCNNCIFTEGGTGVSAIGLSFESEVNVLTLNQCDMFGNSDYSVIYDDDRFPSTIPETSYIGFKLTINECRLDSSVVKIDRCRIVNINAYFEQKTSSPKRSCIILGGAFVNSVKNVSIDNCTARFYDYFVDCLVRVDTISLTNNEFVGISKCALYIPDISNTTIVYENNTEVGSFNDGTRVHTGLREQPFGSTFDDVTFDFDGIVKGTQEGRRQFENPNVYPAAKITNGYLTFNHVEPYYRLKDVELKLSSMVAKNVQCTAVSAEKRIRVTNQSDMRLFNGADKINLGGVNNTYITRVDYDNRDIYVDFLNLDGPQVLNHSLSTPLVSGYSLGLPTVAARYGSVVENIFDGRNPKRYFMNYSSWESDV